MVCGFNLQCPGFCFFSDGKHTVSHLEGHDVLSVVSDFTDAEVISRGALEGAVALEARERFQNFLLLVLDREVLVRSDLCF